VQAAVGRRHLAVDDRGDPLDEWDRVARAMWQAEFEFAAGGRRRDRRREDFAGDAMGRLGRPRDPRDRLDGLADRDAACGQYLAQDGLVCGADRLVALAAAIVVDRLAAPQLDERPQVRTVWRARVRVSEIAGW
jgi:hypothetical protein